MKKHIMRLLVGLGWMLVAALVGAGVIGILAAVTWLFMYGKVFVIIAFIIGGAYLLGYDFYDD